jgi:hypothetical protein
MSRQRIDVEMLDLFKAELALCKVKEGEVVAVLSGGEDQPEFAQTFMLAAQSLGATTFHLNVPKYGQSKIAGVQGRHALAGNRPAIEMLKKTDMVIDLLGLLFSAEQSEIQAAGARILRVMEPFHILKNMAILRAWPLGSLALGIRVHAGNGRRHRGHGRAGAGRYPLCFQTLHTVAGKNDGEARLHHRYFG